LWDPKLFVNDFFLKKVIFYFLKPDAIFLLLDLGAPGRKIGILLNLLACNMQTTLIRSRSRIIKKVNRLVKDGPH
jgi:hypothetical protein